MDQRAHTILVVEDEQAIANELTADLHCRGYAVTHAKESTEALAILEAQKIDILIMDRMLPGLDGLAMLGIIREKDLKMPVLVLSALSSIDDRIKGLKAGGDDYLTKPFSLDELAARVEALLRRPIEMRETSLRVGPLQLDLIEHVAYRGDRKIELVPREFKILRYFMRRPNQTLTRAMLLEDVWHYKFVPETNLVDVHIGKLRRKVDGPNEQPLFRSIHGVGFVLQSND